MAAGLSSGAPEFSIKHTTSSVIGGNIPLASGVKDLCREVLQSSARPQILTDQEAWRFKRVSRFS